jgi:hypothetical protein
MTWFPLQMLCEDRGIFLEIADFIKGLGLTILRGVMEMRKSKIWARFTVEVIQLNWVIRILSVQKYKVINSNQNGNPML